MIIIASRNEKKKTQLYGYLKRQTGEISHKKICTWLQKGNLKREPESFQIATQNNTIKTNNLRQKCGLEVSEFKLHSCY